MKEQTTESNVMPDFLVELRDLLSKYQLRSIAVIVDVDDYVNKKFSISDRAFVVRPAETDGLSMLDDLHQLGIWLSVMDGASQLTSVATTALNQRIQFSLELLAKEMEKYDAVVPAHDSSVQPL